VATVAMARRAAVGVRGGPDAGIHGILRPAGQLLPVVGAAGVNFQFLGKYMKKDISDHQKLVYTRVLIPVLGIIAFLLTMYFPTVLSVQMYAYTVYGAGITPALLAVFLFPQVTRAAGLSSMVTGLVVTLFWEFFYVQSTEINSVIISVPAAII